MGKFTVSDLRHNTYREEEENPYFKIDQLYVNKANSYEVLSFLLYVLGRNSYGLTHDNLHNAEKLMHHEAITGITNKKDISYFIRRNWNVQE